MSHVLQRCSHWKVAHIPINILSHTHTSNQTTLSGAQNKNKMNIFGRFVGRNQGSTGWNHEKGWDGGREMTKIHYKPAQKLSKSKGNNLEESSLKKKKWETLNKTTATKPNPVNCQHWSVSALGLCLWMPVFLHNCASCLSYMLCLFLCALHHITSYKNRISCVILTLIPTNIQKY